MKIIKLSETLNLVADNGQFYLMNEGKQIPLYEVKNPDEFIQLRMNSENLAVLKIADRTFMAERAITAKCHHLCASCIRCRATDAPVGCSKVKERLLDSTAQNKKSAVEQSKRIEKYAFIRAGYQSPEAFVVLSCKDYAFESNVRKGAAPNSSEVLKEKHGLAQFFDERIDFEQYLKWHGSASRKSGRDDVTPITKFA